MPDIEQIEEAAARLDGVSVRTPLLRNADLDQAAGGSVLVKPECLQVTGSFKFRGAYNLMRQLGTGEAKNGVVAWSSGADRRHIGA